LCPGGGVLQISSDRDDRMGPKIKIQKNPKGFKQNPKKSLDQNLTPQKSHAGFPSQKFPEELSGWNMLKLSTIMNLHVLNTL